MSVYTDAVELGGLGESHEKMLALVPPGSLVLDVGSASGYFAAALSERRGATVDGVELNPDDAERAEKHCRRMFVGSVEDPSVVAAIPDGEYDVVVCGDVLEHLVDPKGALERLLPKLKQGGLLVLSVPNVAHHSVRRSLLRGRFEYEDLGLLDRTHLRFFTRKTLTEMVESLGLEIERSESTYRATEVEAAILRRTGKLAGAYRRLLRVATTRFCGLLAYQFVLAARKP